METEGLSKQQVANLLNEMELLDENGEMIWEQECEDEDREIGEKLMDILEKLPTEILPSVEEIPGDGPERELGENSKGGDTEGVGIWTFGVR
jgi:hypothetical protein